MNFLAHIFLSGDSDEIKIGGFIADLVKGNAYLKYSEKIQKGIIIHRAVDEFTDRHPVVKRSMNRLRGKYKRYSGIIVDIFFDHLLAKNWYVFSDKNLRAYIRHFYLVLFLNYFVIPVRMRRALPFMVAGRWLESYGSLKGIRFVIERMAKRTTLPKHTDFAVNELEQNYPLYEQDFLEYFPELIAFVEHKFHVGHKLNH